jgi:hydroxyethylthiazole kinase-like uncharacterized protein yjeF
MLSGLAALRAGAGKVQLGVPQSLALSVGVAFPEAGMAGFAETSDGEPAATACERAAPIASAADAVLIGPGIMAEQAGRALTLGILKRSIGPVFILDAMALTGLWNEGQLLSRHEGRIILTPHAGEMASLTGLTKESIVSNPGAIALEAAARLHCTVVLKGADTYIAQPDGRVFAHRHGNVGLATAGSGDVLAGLMAGLAARGASVLEASLWSVFIHAQAGRRLTGSVGPLGFLARELLAEIPGLLNIDEFPLLPPA